MNDDGPLDRDEELADREEKWLRDNPTYPGGDLWTGIGYGEMLEYEERTLSDPSNYLFDSETLEPPFETQDDPMNEYETWKQGLTKDPEIKGGMECFPGTRLTVQSVGGRLVRGESVETLLDDTNLTRSDLENARTWFKEEP